MQQTPSRIYPLLNVEKKRRLDERSGDSGVQFVQRMARAAYVLTGQFVEAHNQCAGREEMIGIAGDVQLNHTKWYTIDDEKPNGPAGGRQSGQLPVQEERTNGPAWTDELVSLTRPIPETTTETTAEKIHIPFSEPVEYLNAKAGSVYKREE